MTERHVRMLKWSGLLAGGFMFQLIGGCTGLDIVQTGLLGLLAFSTFFIAREVS